jgi:hypothetical protein
LKGVGRCRIVFGYSMTFGIHWAREGLRKPPGGTLRAIDIDNMIFEVIHCRGQHTRTA